ncbi:MAG: glycine rich domain-containing protein, partial [Bacteroidota bacterium]|nr:glycine rich domain-containing protein [Bacteroidota bacterium]
MKKNYLTFLKRISIPVLVLGAGALKAQCPTPTITSSPMSLCQPGGTVNLNAIAVPGSTINWYTVPVAGTTIGTSASSANFNINTSTTTTYYAESISAITNTIDFVYTGTVQTVVIPAGVSIVTIQTWGAEGGGAPISGNTNSGPGGKGGYAIGTLTVVPGNTLNVYVGGFGLSSITGTALGGYNGGGQGHASSNFEPGNGGGGATDVRLNGNAFADRVIIAGGGGGGGEDPGDQVGQGGGLTGVGYVAYDATQTVAGAGGGLGFGGGSGNGDGGGGGGGLYGGGTFSSTSIGQDTQGGGGGSGYIGGVQNGNLIAGNAVMTNTAGNGTTIGNSFNGFARITFSATPCVSVQRGSYVVTVNPNPTITVNSGSICAGNSFTISPSGANSYTIEGGNAVVTPTANTSYTVFGTSTAGCVSQTVSANVSINASPLPTVVVNSGAICAGNSFTMIPSGANTYTFSSGSAVVTPTANSSYSVTGTNASGCVSANAAISSVSVNASPTVTAVSNTSLICTGQTATLTASGANTFTWNTAATTTVIAVSPTVTTSYTVTGTGSNGCTNATTITQSVSACTGIENLSSNNQNLFLNVYPNPNNGEFTISTDSEMNLSIVNN